MLKGLHKNMIYVQLPKEKYFESAYFVIRSRIGEREARHGEMIREANRIIGEMGIADVRKKRESAFGGRISFLIYGVLAGASAVALTWLATLIFL